MISDVIIPATDTEESVILKEGEKVKIIKSEQGFFMQLDNGKVISIRNPIKTGDQANGDYDSDDFEVLDSPMQIPSSGEVSLNPSPNPSPRPEQESASPTPPPQQQQQQPSTHTGDGASGSGEVPASKTRPPRNTNNVQSGRTSRLVATSNKPVANVNGTVPPLPQSNSSFEHSATDKSQSAEHVALTGTNSSKQNALVENHQLAGPFEKVEAISEMQSNGSSVLPSTQTTQQLPMAHQPGPLKPDAFEVPGINHNGHASVGGDRIANGTSATKTNSSGKKSAKSSKNADTAENVYASGQSHVPNAFTTSLNSSAKVMPQTSYGYGYDASNMNGADNLQSKQHIQQQHVHAPQQMHSHQHPMQQLHLQQEQQQQHYQHHQQSTNIADWRHGSQSGENGEPSKAKATNSKEVNVVQKNNRHGQQQQSQKAKQLKQQTSHDMYPPIMVNNMTPTQQSHQQVCFCLYSIY